MAVHLDEEGKVVKGGIALVKDAIAAWAKMDGRFDAMTVWGLCRELEGDYTRAVDVEDVLRAMGVDAGDV